jgi:hypothetical protein
MYICDSLSEDSGGTARQSPICTLKEHKPLLTNTHLQSFYTRTFQVFLDLKLPKTTIPRPHPRTITTMAPTLEEHLSAPSELLDRLRTHLPQSLPVLRRLTYAAIRPGGPASDHARVLYAHSPGAPDFAAAYADPSRGPETEVWFYTTAEDDPAADRDACAAQALLILRRVRRLASAVPAPRQKPHGVLVGAIAESARELILAAGVTTSYHNPTDKFLFRVEALPPPPPAGLPAGLAWDTVRRADLAAVIARAEYPKSEETLAGLPTACVRGADGALVAWAFLHVDGTMATLHVEEPFRGKGLGKAVAGRVMREHNALFGADGWCHSDVTVGNLKSQGVCRSLGATHGWMVSWYVLTTNF